MLISSDDEAAGVSIGNLPAHARGGTGGGDPPAGGRHHLRPLRAGLAARRGHAYAALWRAPALRAAGPVPARASGHRAAREEHRRQRAVLFGQRSAADLRGAGNADAAGRPDDPPARNGKPDRRADRVAAAILRQSRRARFARDSRDQRRISRRAVLGLRQSLSGALAAGLHEPDAADARQESRRQGGAGAIAPPARIDDRTVEGPRQLGAGAALRRPHAVQQVGLSRTDRGGSAMTTSSNR